VGKFHFRNTIGQKPPNAIGAFIDRHIMGGTIFRSQILVQFT
jgi:hypothetical protein